MIASSIAEVSNAALNSWLLETNPCLSDIIESALRIEQQNVIEEREKSDAVSSGMYYETEFLQHGTALIRYISHFCLKCALRRVENQLKESYNYKVEEVVAGSPH